MLKPRLSVGMSLPPRLRAHVAGTVSVGAACVAGAVAVVAASPPSGGAAVGITLFFLLAVLAELRPMPINTSGDRLVSFAFLFIVAMEVLFGWQWGVLGGSCAIAMAMLCTGSERVKVAFNGATYAIAAAAAEIPLLASGPIGKGNYLGLATVVLAASALFVTVNVLLVCGAIGLASGEPVRKVLRDHVRHSTTVFALMALVAVQAIILWRLSPLLVLLLSAPLFALALYQRSSVGRRVAEREALTDSLTGLKNRRAFDNEVQAMLDECDLEAGQLTLCLIDIDRFKQVNDRHGHGTGDAVLTALARSIEEIAPGAGYRLGGDEFAIVAREPGHDAFELTAGLHAAFAAAQTGVVSELVSVSAGLAHYPAHADDLHSLKKRADLALYQSKHKGRSASTLFHLGSEAALSTDLGAALPPAAALAIAQRLAALVDAFAEVGASAGSLHDTDTFSNALAHWRGSDGIHSRAVAQLVVALARRFGIEGVELEQLETAALLHDLGKIAVPEAILNKPGPLTRDERRLVERHSEIAHNLLTALECGPVADFVLHHHERWDGAGYPSGLAGAEIPFGSRLIFVADAFDALTSDRSYRKGVSIQAAIHELRMESGRQFDPLVVDALHDYLTEAEPAVEPLTLQAAWSS